MILCMNNFYFTMFKCTLIKMWKYMKPNFIGTRQNSGGTHEPSPCEYYIGLAVRTHAGLSQNMLSQIKVGLQLYMPCSHPWLSGSIYKSLWYNYFENLRWGYWCIGGHNERRLLVPIIMITTYKNRHYAYFWLNSRVFKHTSILGFS